MHQATVCFVLTVGKVESGVSHAPNTWVKDMTCHKRAAALKSHFTSRH